MLKLACSRKSAAASALIPLAASAALMTACAPNQPPATSPGTQPPVWTGSPAPSSAAPTGQQGGTDSLTTQLNGPTGTKIATAKFDFNQGYVTVTIETTTDGFTKADLLGGAGTAIVIHAGADNFANIPADRYTQVNGAPGPDQTTMMTGDAGKRVACGVIGSG